MEHKGGRIKDHIKREETQEKEDWLDVEWLDDEEDTPGRGDAMQTPSGSDEEPFEIEDWRDEENWNLDRKEESSKEEPAQNADQKPAGDRSGAGASRGGSAKSSQARQSGQGQSTQRKKRPQQGQSSGKDGRKPARKPSQSQQTGKRSEDRRKQEQKDQDRQKQRRSGSAARPVKAAGRAAGKAGKTAGKAVGKGLSIALKCGCFVMMAVIVLELWREFWAERSTLGEIWRVASDRNYAEAMYLGIAGVLLLYGVFSAIWLLGGKKMADGSRLRSYDTGRGLTAFILFAILAAAAGAAAPLIPASPQMLQGAGLALTVVDRVSTVVLGASVIGIVLCVIRKILRR